MTIDILPTIARLAGAALPTRPIDGRDVWPLFTGGKLPSSEHPYFIYWGQNLEAIRSGRWKLHFAHSYPKPSPPGGKGEPGRYATVKIESSLFDLARDPGELKDVSRQNPEVVARLTHLAEGARAELGDGGRKEKGRGVREPGRVR
jgi:arylsulfatase A